MPAEISLRSLAEMEAGERAFLTVCLAGPRSAAQLEDRFAKLRRALRGGRTEKDEREYFDENAEAVLAYLSRTPLKSGSLCLFVCKPLDVFHAVPLTRPVPDCVWIDSSPYIRPLAEYQEEYENAAVVVADNKKARVFLVSMAVPGPGECITGNVKNHVRKGGWSQQRYERRRDKQLLHYAREIVAALAKLAREEALRRILLVGGREIIQAIEEDLPQALRGMVAERAVDLGKGERAVYEQDVMDLFMEQERLSEAALWEKIRLEYLRGGLAVAGLEDVLAAAELGQVESVVVDRGYRPEGRRCRDCGALIGSAAAKCPACSSDSLFEVDVVNEIVELLARSGGEADFVDTIDTLKVVGGIAALLRYKL